MTNYSPYPILLINASVICTKYSGRYLVPINISLNLYMKRISSVKLCYDASSVFVLCDN